MVRCGKIPCRKAKTVLKTEFMREALSEAQKAFDEGEVPVGAVVVRGGEIVARAHNMVETARRSSAVCC